MKQVAVLAFVLLVGSGRAAQADSTETLTLRSPDGSTVVALAAAPDAPPIYTISRKGEVVIAPSQLRLVLEGDRGFYSFEVASSKTRSVDEVHPLIATKASSTRDRFNELALSLIERGEARRRLDLIFRAYDDGVAFRYSIPKQADFAELLLRAEETHFAFPADYACFGLNIGRMDTSHEGEFDPVRARMIREHNLYDAPLTCKTASGASAFALAEADLREWSGTYFSGLGSGDIGVYTRLSRRHDDPRLVVRRDMTDDGIQSPWRVVMLSDTAGELIESTLIANLNPATPLKDTAWIKGGKTAWDWWSGPYLPPPLEGGTDMRTIERYIDFASEAGFPYMLIDEGWCLNSGVGGSAPPNADITRTKPGIDMPELVRYAREREVGLWLWVQWALLDRQMDAALKQYEAWGIKGIKVDFMDRNDQEMVGYYHRVMAKAAEHKLMVNMHGAYPPTGLARTYPNYLTQEGVMGAEYNKWSRRVTATHNVTLPFTRMLLGPIDYTPGGFRNKTPQTFEVVNSPPQVQTTRGQALAMFVVYESPLQMVADSPDAYENAQGFDFIKLVPATWDETRFIAGEIAEYIVVARRKGDVWYVGAMTNETGRTIEVPLRFLGDGEYDARIWEDGASPTMLREHERTNISSNAVLELELAPGGGAVARMTR